MSKTASELVNFCKSALGTNYVYGAKWQVLTQTLYNQLKKAYPSYVPDSDAKKIGTLCTDCSGLICACTGIIRGSASYKSTAKEVYDISATGKLVAGVAVYKVGHIGVYIGNGKVIEAKGSAYGTIESNVSSTAWTHILYLCDIDYANTSVDGNHNTTSGDLQYTVKSGDTLSAIAKSYNTTVANIVAKNGIADANKISVGQILSIPSNTTNTTTTTEVVGMCTGNGVRVRTNPSLSADILRQLNKGNLFQILGYSGEWVHVNVAGTIGYVHSDYVI